MLYWLLIIDAILIGVIAIILIIAIIKGYLYAKEYYQNQQDAQNAYNDGQEKENNRTNKILKQEYLTAKEQNDQKTMKTILQINKQIKEKEEN